MKDFTSDEWNAAEQKLRGSEFDLAGLKDWLAIPENQTRLAVAFGEGWTLDQALELCGIKASRATPPTPFQVKMAEPRDRSDGIRPTREAVGEMSDKVDLASLFDSEEFKRRVAARIAEYQHDFGEITTNDLATVRNLAGTEIGIDAVNQLLAESLGDPRKVSRYTHALKEMTELSIALQRSLGIDRVARSKAEEKQSDADKVLEIMRESGEWLERQGIRIEHCGILYGLYITDFREIPFTIAFTCPRCNEKVEIPHIPNDNDLRAVEPDWVALEEGQYRVRAALETAAQVLGDETDADLADVEE